MNPTPDGKMPGESRSTTSAKAALPLRKYSPNIHPYAGPGFIRCCQWN